MACHTNLRLREGLWGLTLPTCMSSTSYAHTCALVPVWLHSPLNTTSDGLTVLLVVTLQLKSRAADLELQCHYQQDREGIVARKDKLCHTWSTQGPLSHSGGSGASCWMGCRAWEVRCRNPEITSIAAKMHPG